MNYDAFLFEGHGTSEKTGGYDPGATNGNVTENYLVDKINKAAKKYLDTIGLNIHYDENNFTDNDLLGNTYSNKAGASVHINSSVGASGVEVFVPINEKYLGMDFTLCSEISKLLGIPNRGVKSRDYNTERTIQRVDGQSVGGTDYYGEIRNAWKQGISLSIIEVGFIQADLQKIQDRIDEIGYLIAKYIAAICGKTLNKPVTPPPVTNSNTYYRVVCGSFNSRIEAEKRQAELKSKGYESFLDIFKK